MKKKIMKILDEFVGGRERHASMCADRLIKLFNEHNAVLPQTNKQTNK